MKTPFPGGDTLPWYRQFWPWFLILLPATVVVASLNMVYIASRDADDLVVDEYYKDGLAINRQLEKKQRATDLGVSARLSFTPEYVTARIDGPVDAAELSLLLSHPLEADLDFEVTLGRTAPGVYRAILPRAVAPHWLWTLKLEQPDGWRLDDSVQAHDIGNAASD